MMSRFIGMRSAIGQDFFFQIPGSIEFGLSELSFASRFLSHFEVMLLEPSASRSAGC